MTVAEQLAVLEEVAGVIDPKVRRRNARCLRRIPGDGLPYYECQYYDGKKWLFSQAVRREVAFAIRERQAREWIENRCKKKGWRDVEYRRAAIGTSQYCVTIIPRGDEPIPSFVGRSWAEVLAAAVKKLVKVGETA